MPVPIKPFEDFKLHKAADNAVIEKYTNVLPHALINIWKEYGFGTFAKGFLRTINPDEYRELLNETHISISKPIPVFTTALGDILVFREKYFEQKNATYFYFDIVFYRYGNDRLVTALVDLNDDDYFKDVLTNQNSYTSRLEWDEYPKAVKKYGIVPEYDECYGYVPLLGLGGKETVKNMRIVKLKEHIMLIKEMVGPVQSKD